MPDFQSNYTILSTPEVAVTEPQQFFNWGGFEQALQEHGYNVYLDSMIDCPCRARQTKAHLSSCKNCGGTGWAVVKRKQTKIIVQSANINTRYLEWSEEKVGSVRISVSDRDSLKYMDRIIVLDTLVSSNEICYPNSTIVSGTYLAFTNYWIQKIDAIWWFQSSTQELVRLLEGVDFTFTKNVISFNPQFVTDFGNDLSFSVTYSHYPQYHVIDINREFLTQKAIDRALEKKDFPLSGMAKRSHFVLDRQNYSDDYLLNNSSKSTIGYYGTGSNPDLTLLDPNTQICS